MRQEKSAYDRLLEQALNLSEKAFPFPDETDIFIEGRVNILSEPEFANVSRMSDLFRAFDPVI